MPDVDGQLTVFLSSTFDDLTIHRRMAVDVLSKFGMRTFTAEQTAAVDDDIAAFMRQSIEASDGVLLLIGDRSGAMLHAPGLASSFVEYEYELARKLGKPLFVLLKNAAREEPEESPKNAELYRQLSAFRRRVAHETKVRTFESMEDFQAALIVTAGELQTLLSRSTVKRASTRVARERTGGRAIGPIESAPHIWIFYAKDPGSASPWARALSRGDTVWWRHGNVGGGGSYRRQLEPGDTVLLLVGPEIIANGILLAADEMRFVDVQRRIRRPVRIIERYARPLDRESLEDRLGGRLIIQGGAVHPVSPMALTLINEDLAMSEQGVYGGPSPLPLSKKLIQSELARQSLVEDLEEEAPYLRPDARTAEVLGWKGPVWVPLFPESEGAEQIEATSEEELIDSADEMFAETAIDSMPDTDARIPFVLDAPADSEDQLDRGHFALFLAQRLHLIWCQMNGHAPNAMGGPTTPAAPDSDTFIAHVDSPWGGGKTTFANFLARVLDPRGQKLTPRHFLRSSLARFTPDGELDTVSLEEIFVPPFARQDAGKWRGARRPWIIARYNAWRDQYVQPPWWQVFLAIESEVARETRREASQNCKRAWFDGEPLRYARAAWLYAKYLWVGGQRIAYQIWNRKLQAQLLLFSSAAILVLILAWTGWLKGIFSPGYEPKKASEWIALATALLGLGGAGVAALFTVITQSLSPDLDFTAEHKQIGVQDPISRFRRTFHRILRATDRPVLLIVDDLDRCEPRAVVELLRGFQTIIRSPRLFVLLLGDRAWIENAHDVYHKDLGSLREGESGLGARFVQKVIQLSFRLPTIKPVDRERFARDVLGDVDRETKASVTEVLRRADAEMTEIVSGPGSIASKEADLARVVDTTRATLSEELGYQKAEGATDLAGELASLKLVAAAGSDASQQRTVYNAVTQLVGSLPNNPRQIKRIFMAFATYELVGRAYFGYQLTPEGEEGEHKAKRWRQLAIWVTLAIEWPETWRAIARRPALLDLAYANDTDSPDVAKPGKPLSDAEKLVIQRLRTDRTLRTLLTARSGASRQGFGETAMEVGAVCEFNRIIWEPEFEIEGDLEPEGVVKPSI
jgi:hypothetical protein